jgi:uncharacterized membrane protein
MDKDKGVVLALFENEAAADAAVDALKAWDELDDDVKLNSIGMMVLDEDGKLKIHKVGRRRGIAKGVGGGAVLVLLTGYLITPLGLPILGGLVGATRKHIPMSDEDRDRLAGELKNGKAAVGVLVKLEQRDAASEKLAELGGSPEQTLELTPELEAAAGEVPECEAQVSSWSRRRDMTAITHKLARLCPRAPAPAASIRVGPRGASSRTEKVEAPTSPRTHPLS